MKSILKRIDILGVSEPEITIEGDNRIRVKLAGVTNKEEAREVLSWLIAIKKKKRKIIQSSKLFGIIYLVF